MKNIYYALVSSLMIITMHASNEDTGQNMVQRFFTQLQQIAYKTPFFAGYHSTPEQKVIAQIKIDELIASKNELESSLSKAGITSSEAQEIATNINDINKQ